jgi:hypothetical protein
MIKVKAKALTFASRINYRFTGKFIESVFTLAANMFYS